MAFTADKVVIELLADTDNFERGMHRASATSDRTFDGIGKAGTKAEKSLSASFERMQFRSVALGSAIGSVLGNAVAQLPGMLIRAGSAALDYASSLGETAQQLGVTSKALQEYRFIGGQVGIETEEMDRALQFLTKSLGQAQNGAKGPTDALKKLGFNAKEMGDLIQRDAGDVIPELADRLSRIPNAAQRAAIEIALFGRQGQRLDTLLAGGRGQIDQLRDSVNRLGGVLSEEQIQRADETADKLRALKDVISARIASAVADNADSILSLANALAVLIGKLGSATSAYDGFMAKVHQFQANAARSAYQLPGVLGGGYLEFSPNSTAHRDFINREQGLANQYRQSARESDPTYQRIIHTSPFKDFKQRDVAYIPEEQGRVIADTTSAVTAHAAQVGGATAQKAQQDAQDARDRLLRYLDETAQLQQQYNSALADIVGTEQARAAAQKQNIDIQEASEERRIQADDEYTDAQKQAQISQLRINAAKEKQAIDARETVRMEEENRAVIAGAITNERDLLQAQEGLTDNRDERAAIEKRLVDLAIQEERVQLNGIISSQQASDAQKALAQQRLGMLDQLQATQKAGIDRQNLSPMQSWLKSIPHDAQGATDALQGIATNGLDEIASSLGDVITGTKSLGDAFNDVARSVVRDLIQMTIRMLMFRALSSAFPSLFSGGASATTAALGSMDGAGAFAVALPAFASGGSFRVNGGTDNNLLSINGQARARVSGDETIAVIPNNAAAASPWASAGPSVLVVKVEPNDERFDAYVESVTGPMVAQGSTRAAYAGAGLARNNLARRQIHQLGSRG